MSMLRVARFVFFCAMFAALGIPGPAVAQDPARCSNQDGTCASAGQNQMMCVVQSEQNLCVAPSGAEVCADGHKCPVGTACGNLRQMVPEDDWRFFPCYAGGAVVVHDGAVGGPCRAVDGHGVTHVCKTARCDGDSPSSLCMPDRSVMPSSPGG